MSGRGGDQTLTVPADSPVVGWRYWHLPPEVGLLRSVSQTRFRWHPGEPLRAVCTGGGHDPPHPGCGCGIYGARELQALCDRGLCLGPEPLVVGEVALWGPTIADGEAHRARFAYPRSLHLIPETAGEAPVDALLEALRAYEAPTGTLPLARVVGEVSAQLIAYQRMSAATSRTPVDPAG